MRARLRDDANALAVAIDRLDTELDVLVLSGGVSMGQFDFVPSVLTELGAKLVLHKVEQRPGRPMWFGVSARGKPIFALPGNPVSTLVCATRYLLPALRHASGLAAAPPELVELTTPIEGSPTLTLFTPVTLSSSDRGTLLATPHRTEHLRRLRHARGHRRLRRARRKTRLLSRRHRRPPLPLVKRVRVKRGRIYLALMREGQTY